MNILKPEFSRPSLMGSSIFDDLGHSIMQAGRSAADLWNRATAPTVVTTAEPDRTPLYLGLAGIAAVGAILILKPKRRTARR